MRADEAKLLEFKVQTTIPHYSYLRGWIVFNGAPGDTTVNTGYGDVQFGSINNGYSGVGVFTGKGRGLFCNTRAPVHDRRCHRSLHIDSDRSY